MYFIQGSCLEELKKMKDESVDCIITSPPYYGLRDYGVDGQIGLEPSLNEYLEKMLQITAELKRVLKKEGTMWWNHGDSYSRPAGKGGSGTPDPRYSRGQGYVGNDTSKYYPEKSLILQAHRLAIRMVDEQGWILRNQIIWHKPNVMPQSVRDRFTVDFEPVFFFSKSKKYWFETQYEPRTVSDEAALKKLKVSKVTKKIFGTTLQQGANWKQGGLAEYKITHEPYVNPLGRNKRTVWKIPTKPFKEAHFATFPEALVEPMIKAGCPPNGIVLDPFAGAGTTCLVARKLGRDFIGIELNSQYIEIAKRRLLTI